MGVYLRIGLRSLRACLVPGTREIFVSRTPIKYPTGIHLLLVLRFVAGDAYVRSVWISENTVAISRSSVLSRNLPVGKSCFWNAVFESLFGFERLSGQSTWNYMFLKAKKKYLLMIALNIGLLAARLFSGQSY